MKIKNIYDGLEILMEYTGEDAFACSASHDIFQVASTSENFMITPDDAKKLVALGWFWNDETECWACFP